MPFPIPLTAVSLSLLFSTAAALGQNIVWGTSNSYNSSSYISYTSSGIPDKGEIKWNLGFFSNSFTPTQQNSSEWADYWVAVDETFNINSGLKHWGLSANFSVMGETESGKLGSSAIYGGSKTGVSSGDLINAADNKIWIFCYNDLAKIGTAEGEALLYSYNTNYPNSRTTVTTDLNIANEHDLEVIWGRIDRDYLNLGGIQQGGGQFSYLIPEGEGVINGSEITGATFEAQLGSWGTPSSYEEALNNTSFTIAESLPDADPENRGLSNALSYALNIPISGPINATQRLKLPQMTGLTAESFRLRFETPASLPSDITYCIMESEGLDLNSWTEIARATNESSWSGRAVVSTSTEANTTEVLVQPTNTSSQRSFLRLDIILSE